MPEVIMLCGRIAAGKSYYADKLKAKGAVVLSCDDLMLSLYDGCLGERHDGTVLAIERYFCRLAPEIISLGGDVVLDYGHWSRALRDEVKRVCRENGISCRLHYVTADDAVRVSRLKKRNEENSLLPGRHYIINEELLKRLDAKFEEPDEEEIDLTVKN